MGLFRNSAIDENTGQQITAPLNNTGATTDPLVTDDDTKGYGIGSEWINTVDGTNWKCMDATASNAVWKDVTGALTESDVYALNVSMSC